MAEGQVVSWGMAQKENVDGGYTHAGWVTYPNYAAMTTVENAFGEAFADVSPEEQAEIMAGFIGATEPNAAKIRHLRSVVAEISDDPIPIRYLVTADWDAAFGKGEDARALYERVRPAFARLFADGVLAGYGLYEVALHDGGSSHLSWYSMTDLGAMDQLEAAFATLENPPSPDEVAAVFNMENHRDTLWLIRHLGGSGDGGGEMGDGGGEMGDGE